MTTHYDTVKYVEYNGKWLWKRYDEQGSVVYRSPEFNSEEEARADYDQNWGSLQTQGFVAPGKDPHEGETPTTVIAPDPEEIERIKREDQMSAGTTTPEGDVNAGTAAQEPEEVNTNA